MDNLITIYILILLNIFSFLLGYLYGKLKNIGYNFTTHSIKTKNKPDKITTTSTSDIVIDDKKVVVNINTKGLEKKYDELGDKQISENTITSSVNKLKNLKG